MRVQILTVSGAGPEAWEVTFRSAAGAGRGAWRGPVPVAFDVVDVELALDDALEWGRNVRWLPAGSPEGLHERDERAILVGRPASPAAGGTLALEVGGDCVLMRVAGEPAPAPEDGALLGVAAARLRLHDSQT